MQQPLIAPLASHTSQHTNCPTPQQTNNPRKISELSELGVQVTERVPCIVQAGTYNEGYLSVKQDRMAHMLDSTDTSDEDEAPQAGNGQQLNGEFCYWNHEGEPGSAGIALSPASTEGDGQAVLLNGSKPKSESA